MQLLFDNKITVFDKVLSPFGIDKDADSSTYYYVYTGAKRAAIIIARVFDASGLVSYDVVEADYGNISGRHKEHDWDKPIIQGGLMSVDEFQEDLEAKLTDMIQPVYKIPSNALAEPFIKFNEALKVAIKKLFR